MALTSAERKSFDKIVTQLTTSDRWFTWRTAPRTRRGLWLRRQLWHVVAATLAIGAAALAVRALLVRSTVAGGCALARLGRRMWARALTVPARLARWARATCARVGRRKNPRR